MNLIDNRSVTYNPWPDTVLLKRAKMSVDNLKYEFYDRRMKELKTRKTLLRQEFLDLEEDIKQLRREIKRVKPSVWQKIRTGMKRMWLKLISKCPKHKLINQTMDQMEEDLQIKPQATLALDTPSKRILISLQRVPCFPSKGLRTSEKVRSKFDLC